MKTNNIIAYIILMILTFQISVLNAQEKKEIKDYTREEVLNIPYDQLIELPLEDLLILADIVGVSLDELYEMILNKDLVSASKSKESSFEAPLSTSVVSYNEIVASGARTIEEALRLVPGLIIREKTNGNFDIHIRGNDNLPSRHMFLYSENSITLVMIDGRQVYNYVHGGTFWETLPIGIEDIERIEIVRGPSSALYGPNAVSGVINLITKQAKSENINVVADAQLGTLNTVVANLGISQKLTEKLSYRISGNLQGMDRNSDLLYTFLAEDYINKVTLDSMHVYSTLEGRNFLVYDPADGINKMYPDPRRAKDLYGVNGFFRYRYSDEIQTDVSIGYQASEVLTSTMGDNPTIYAGRQSKTMYADARGKVKDLKVQVNLLDGWQDIIRQDTGFKVDIMNFNSVIEYELEIGDKLKILPGFTYQKAIYNDLPHLKPGQGFLNGEKSFQNIAMSLRSDYRPVESLRLIAALRGEKYDTHDDLYFSYQFIGSYNLNNKHNFRAVYSRANRGPFLVDAFANYVWIREERPIPGVIHFKGSNNLDLLTMDMIEVGYRIKPIKNIQADFEFFQTFTKNFGALYPDSVNLLTLNYEDPKIDPMRPYVSMSFQNLDLTARQRGVTGSISFIINMDLNFKIFGTYQVTKVYDVIPDLHDNTVQDMIISANVANNLDSTITYNTRFTEERIDEEDHLWTPTFYGGMVIDYKFFKQRVNININSYYYTEQTLLSKYGEGKIDPKFIVNSKISYKFFKESYLYLNCRNIIGEKKEYPFMDKIGTNYLIGLHFDF